MIFQTFRSRLTVMSLLVLSSLSCVGALGQTPETSLGDVVHRVADNEVSRYEISLAGKDVVLERIPRSLLRWSNATRNSAFGDTYIWTHDGCARAIISIFGIGAPKNLFSAECQSLAEGALTMRRNDVVKWSPTKPGIEFKPVKGVRAPASAAPSRLVQMNAIARRFRAEFAPHTAPGEFTQLRLLSKPLFRYDSTNSEVVDGAVYGFVDATDPEMLLVVEARRDGEDVSWFFAPARSRHDHLRLYLNGAIVWDVPRLAPPWENIRKPDKTYFNLQLQNLLSPGEWQQLVEAFSG